MIATTTPRKLAGWRINPITIKRVKEAAKLEKISANDFVERALDNATMHIETEEEKKERLMENYRFLEQFAGTWSGPESSSEIMENIKSSNKSKVIIDL